MRMKHLTVAALTLLLSVSCSQRQEDYPFRNPDLPIDERIDDLLKRLTAEEKVGQMMNTTPAIERLEFPNTIGGTKPCTVSHVPEKRPFSHKQSRWRLLLMTTHCMRHSRW